MRRSMMWVCAAMGLMACDKKESGQTPAAPDAGEAKPASKLGAEDVAAVEAKLPEALKGMLSFEVVTDEDKRFVALQPKGWEQGVIPGRVRPPQGGPDMGFLTIYGTGTNCDGVCEPKAWAEVSDKVEFAQLSGSGWTVDKDEKLPDGRLVVARQDGRVDVALARWKEGGRHYAYCRATLERPLMEAAAAFEEACRRLTLTK